MEDQVEGSHLLLSPCGVPPVPSIGKEQHRASWQRKHVYRVQFHFYKGGQGRVHLELKDNKLITEMTFKAKLNKGNEYTSIL